MIVILKREPEQQKVEELIKQLRAEGLDIHYSRGAESTLIGLIGDTSRVDMEALASNEIVESVKRVSEPYKLANRKFHADDTQVTVGNAAFGGGAFGVIAGPCSVESEEQIVEAARRVKAAGARLLRGGAFKPRTSPYAFRGLKAEGIELLKIAKRETGLPLVSELTGLAYLGLYDDVDVIQVGARNMQNFDMLSELGHSQKPILLKRGLSNTLEELLMSAEYILSGGNRNVILCERGIRTFETATRNTLDIAGAVLLKKLTHLPVVIDPSHATGNSELVRPLSKAAVAAGVDGLIIEVHPNPACALCDGKQSVTCDAFDGIMQDVKRLCAAEGKVV